MLVSRCMEHQVRMIQAHDLVDTVGITDRTDQHQQIQIRMVSLKLHLNIIGIIFVNIQNDQLRRIGSCDLTAKLTADGSTATGNQNHLIGHIAHDLIGIDTNGLPAQQILGIHITQLTDADITVDHLINAGKCLHFATGGRTDVQNLLPGLCAAAGNCEDNRADLVTVHHSRNFFTATHDGNAAQPLSMFYRIVINDTNQIIPDILTADKLCRQGSAGITGTDQHHMFHAGRVSHMGQFYLRRSDKPVGKTDAHRTHAAQD